MTHRLLRDTLTRASQGLALKSPKYLGTRSIARPLASAIRLLCQWFVAKRSSLELDRSSDECMSELLTFFGAADVDVLEKGLSKLQRIRNPYRLDLEGPPPNPDSRMTIDVIRSGNRLYDVRLLSAETRDERGWVALPLRPEDEAPGFVRQLYALRVLLLDERTAITHLRCRLVAATVTSAESHLLYGEVIQPRYCRTSSPWGFRVHALPKGVRASVRLRRKTDDTPCAVVQFTPPLAPGQTADYSIVVQHSHDIPITTECAVMTVPGGNGSKLDGFTASRAIRVATSTATFELTTMFPRGYTIGEPSLFITDTNDLVRLPEEEQRIYAASGLSLKRHGTRHRLHLSVERPVVGATYRVVYRPSRYSALPAALWQALQVPLPPTRPRHRPAVRSSRKPRQK